MVCVCYLLILPSMSYNSHCFFCIGIPYEITTYTSDVSGAGTSADVYIVLYGRDTCTSKKSLCPNKNDRKKNFDKAKEAKFVIEVFLHYALLYFMCFPYLSRFIFETVPVLSAFINSIKCVTM